MTLKRQSSLTSESLSPNLDHIHFYNMNNGAIAAGCYSSRKRSRIEDSFSALSIDAEMSPYSANLNDDSPTLDAQHYEFMTNNSDRMSTSMYDATSSMNGNYSSSSRAQSNGMSMSDESSVSDGSETSGSAIENSSTQKELLYKLVFGNTYRREKSRRVGYVSTMSHPNKVDDKIEELIRSSRIKAESFHDNGGMDYGRNIPPPPPAASPVEPDSPRFSGEPSHSEFITVDDEFVPSVSSTIPESNKNVTFSTTRYEDWNEKWSNTSLYSFCSDDGMDI